MADRRKRKQAANVDAISREIGSEIRRILRKWYSLKTPIQTFREVDRPAGRPSIEVYFGTSLLGPSPHDSTSVGVQDKSIGTLGLPDERINDALHHFAGSVWHLRDRIRRWDRARGTSPEVVKRRITKLIGESRDLQICGELITEKKHGAREDRSGLQPWLSGTHFDTSKNGAVEFWYDGAVKEAYLLVTIANPVPYRVDVYRGDDPAIDRERPDEGAKIGDAVDIISSGFRAWLPLIRDLGILDGDGPEENALVQILKPLCDLRAEGGGGEQREVGKTRVAKKTARKKAVRKTRKKKRKKV